MIHMNIFAKEFISLFPPNYLILYCFVCIISASALNNQLHEKLKLAAEQISRLLQEKSTLLEAGNSLGAELAAYKKHNPEKMAGKDDFKISGFQFFEKMPLLLYILL